MARVRRGYSIKICREDTLQVAVHVSPAERKQEILQWKTANPAVRKEAPIGMIERGAPLDEYDTLACEMVRARLKSVVSL